MPPSQFRLNRTRKTSPPIAWNPPSTPSETLQTFTPALGSKGPVTGPVARWSRAGGAATLARAMAVARVAGRRGVGSSRVEAGRGVWARLPLPPPRGVRARGAAPSASSLSGLPAQEFWVGVVGGRAGEGLRPAARGMLARLDWAHPAGVDVQLKGVSAGRKGSVFEFLMEVKRKHPTKVVLVRVGDFYEVWGFDAIALVQHAGLNPMGREGVPRAGCPKQNLRATLDDLTAAGLSVVVCEEVPQPYSYGARARRKDRFVAGVVTPAAPTYVHGLAGGDLEADFRASAPVFGVSRTRQGFLLAEVDPEARRCITREGLTEEAVVGCISAAGFSPPLYLHRSVSEGGEGAALRAMAQGAATATWSGGDAGTGGTGPVEVLLGIIQADLGLGEEHDEQGGGWTVTPACQDGRPRPLYLATAANVGLAGGPGVPDLAAALLPPDTPAMCKHYIRRLLLQPPPPDVAAAVRQAVTVLAGGSVALPPLPCLPASKLAKLIGAREANHLFFCEVGELTRQVRRFLAVEAFQPAVDSLLRLTSYEAGLSLGVKGLAGACGSALAEISSVLEDDQSTGAKGHLERGSGPAEVGGEAEGVEGSSRVGGPAFEQMEASLEDFRGRVQPACLPKEMGALQEARRQAAVLTVKLLAVALEAEAAGGTGARSRPRVVFDPVNQAVALRGSLPKETREGLNLVHPRDRNGVLLSDRWSFPALEEAQEAYRQAAFEAGAAVTRELRALAGRLQPFLADLVGASVFSVAVRALGAHAAEASRRAWVQPEMHSIDARPGECPLELEGLWPYWMDCRDPGTVLNTFDVHGLVLLTGPNMAGKSTVIRSVCAAALLANCGLRVPASKMRCPHYDAFMLRAVSGDSPSQGLSSFAVEMAEARTILRDAGSRSLVFLDELGKGTEAVAGTAVAGATVEALAAAGCHGIFATHMHDLLDLGLNFGGGRVQEMAMGTTMGGGGDGAAEWTRRPTWKIAPGRCTESLAFAVARDQGVPPAVVERSVMLYRLLERDRRGVPRGNAKEPPRPEAGAGEEAAAVPPPPEISTSTGPGNSLDAGANILFAVTEGLLERCGELEDGALAPIGRVGAGDIPPAATAGASCVYLLQDSAGLFYCGETDDLPSRYAQHRARPGSERAQDLVFVRLPPGTGKSRARAAEAFAIGALRDAGFPMRSTADAAHTKFSS